MNQMNTSRSTSQCANAHQGEEIPVHGIDNDKLQSWLNSIGAFRLRTFETPHYRLSVYVARTRQFTVKEWTAAGTFEVYVPVSLVAATQYIKGER